MKILEKCRLLPIKKIIGGIFMFIIILYLGIFIYSYTFEQDKIAIDKYNFEQLEKFKTIIKTLKDDNYIFYDIKNFNKKYNTNIKPIKNCYYIKNKNLYSEELKGGGYVFGFKLESLFNKFLNFGSSYAYPSYNLPKEKICFGSRNSISDMRKSSNQGCYDVSNFNFNYIISNPCKD